MESKIEKLSRFVSKHFGIEEKKLYSSSRNSQITLARHFAWYYLHKELNVSIGTLSKEFFRSKRAVFKGISNIGWMIENQRIYRDMYNNFTEEYKKATP